MKMTKTSAMQQRLLCNMQHNVVLVVVAIIAVMFAVLLSEAQATPMMYKKNTQHKYEADLVPVSSTVIPLTVLEVSYGLGGKPSEEYKMAYLKKLRKKVLHAGEKRADEPEIAENPDELITIQKKKHHHDVKVKSSSSSN